MFLHEKVENRALEDVNPRGKSYAGQKKWVLTVPENEWNFLRAGTPWAGRGAQILSCPEMSPQQTETQNNQDLRVVATGILPQSIEFLLPRTAQRASPSQSKLDFNLTLISAHFCAPFSVLWLSFSRKMPFQAEIWCSSSFLLSLAALIPCQEHFKGARGLPVPCLPHPSSLNSHNPAPKGLRACCCFLLLLILLLCLFWHKKNLFYILLPCLGFWSKFN